MIRETKKYNIIFTKYMISYSLECLEHYLLVPLLSAVFILTVFSFLQVIYIVLSIVMEQY